MKAAIVQGAGQAPVFGDFEEPVAGPGEHRIAVSAAAMSHLVKMRASGQHYSTAGDFPFVVGIDGVGRLDDGRRFYFALPRAPFGAMAERTVVAAAQCVPVPDELDDVTAAAIANPGMSSWVALAERAQIKAGETVLINGATGTSGRLAVQIARHLGAGRIIATGRSEAALRDVAALGADATILLGGDERAQIERFMPAFAQGIDIVLDYLWGPGARALLIAAAKAGREGVPMRFVQIGSLAGPDIALPAAVLRASPIELMGSGLGSVALDRLVAHIGALLAVAAQKGFIVAATPVPLAQVAQAWADDDSSRRTVFTL